MGGKNSTSTQTVAVPPEVLARYNAVNAQAQQTASRPFQQYSTSPSAFVAPLTQAQQQGISQTGAYANTAQPYYSAADQQVQGGLQAAGTLYGEAIGNTEDAKTYGYGGLYNANQALGGANSASAAPMATAGSEYQAALRDAAPLLGQAIQNYSGASASSNPLLASAGANYSGAQSAAAPWISAAGQGISQAQNASSPLLAAAGQNFSGAQQSSLPLLGQAGGAYSGAYSGAQPYNAGATNFALAGGQAVNPDALNVGAYLSPYLSTVLGSTQALINQGNQQQMQGALGDIIRQGAFGGDRAGIAAANLAQQQNLAAGQIYSNILNQGYNTALGAAQQQQGVGLGAAQANRAALQQTGAALQGIGQQNYTQGMGLGSALQGLGGQLYAQDLGAGQAQQGLAGQVFGQGLQASQAQQGIGSQLFGQNLSAGQAEQGLGAQAFGQGITSGQAMENLGQTVYGQHAGLGQAEQGLGAQLFGQGLSTSQQAAALGQQGTNLGLALGQQYGGFGQQAFGMNQSAAQTTAGLGAGAQEAGLQGAQALLGAGQAQQQTQQAGLTALYNQFLQQQSYPFQVSQFLANIAEGTGALSGSTTTTTQPGGLFSDRRLKEGVEPIGQTYDGQKIVKFRYKGDPTTRIGLIAQDVEKDHPEAVGLAGGYRTVDYDEATKDAAKRGHFRSGGLAAANDNREVYADGGFATGTYGPNYADVLAAQARMYAPFQAGGLYGSSPNAPPMGGTSYVPAANLPVSKLAVAGGGLQPRKTPLEQANDVANLATSVEKGLQSKTGQKVLHGLGLGGGGSDTIDPETLYARGGLARSAHGMGGAPYQNQLGMGLDIPDEEPTDKTLATPSAPPGKPHSAVSDVADVAKTAAELAKFIPGLARGGAADADFMPDVEGDGADDQSSILKLARRLLSEGSDENDSQDQQVVAAPGVSSPSVAAPAPANIDVQPQEKLSGLPSDLRGTLKLIAKAEGTGKNPMSSAKGLYQITDPTFVGAYRQMFPDKAQSMSKQDILALRQTPEGDELSAQMGPWIARQNIDRLKAAGVEPTPANVYLAHFLGSTGALKVLQAPGDTPLEKLLSPLAIAENGSILRGKTAGELQKWAFNRLQQVNRSTYATGGRTAKADGGETDDAALSATDFPDPVDAQVQAPGARPQAAQPQTSDRHGGIWDNLKKPEVFIPILSGLAAMATAPTQHFGTALAAGVGAGAQAYQKQREFALEQMQKQAQAALMGSESAALGLRPTELAIRQYEAYTGRLNAQMQAFSQTQQAFDANYQQLPNTGPDGFPMYLNRVTGERLTQGQYSAARNRYLQTSLSGIGNGQGLGPLGAISTLGAPQSGVANGTVPGVPADGNRGIDAGGMGAGAAGAGPVGAVAGSPGTGPASVVPAVPHGAGGAQPPVQVGGKLKDKLEQGVYLRPAVPLPQIDNSQIADNSNPAILMQQGRELQQNATDPQVRAQGEAMIERAQRIMSGVDIPLGKDGQPYMGYVRMAQARGAADKVTQSYAGQIEQQNQGASTFAEQYPQNMQILNSLKRIYSETDVNRLSGDWADLIGNIRSIPGLKDRLQPQLKAYQDAVDEAHKDAARQQIVAAVAADMANKAPASALHVTGMTVPSPSMGAGARYNLVSQLYAQQQLAKDFYRDWNSNKSKVMDVSSYVNDWTAEHPISAYEKWAYDHIAPFPGMTRDEMLQHPRRPRTPDDLKGLRPGLPFVIPSGPHAGQIGWTQ